MTNFITNWLRDESGAITVDWVVLTAAVVGLGVAAVASARTGVNTLAVNIASGVSSQSVGNASTTP
ncbi:Flp family type IVb pilin [Roseovarius aquimarinus]|uniref:Flp family type IVb pilin n=1 Tax=Roseovarius aquimarinus TaxID=1229156 RepID=A0ABW7I7R3_9RHOB